MKNFNEFGSCIVGVTVQAEIDIEDCAKLCRSTAEVCKMHRDAKRHLDGIFDMAKFMFENEDSLDDCKIRRLVKFTYMELSCSVNNIIAKYNCK